MIHDYTDDNRPTVKIPVFINAPRLRGLENGNTSVRHNSKQKPEGSRFRLSRTWPNLHVNMSE